MHACRKDTIQRVYNSFEQLVTEYQEHSGAVNISTSVNVEYQYADGSSNTNRATALVYPNGRVLNYDYGTSGGIDDALSRIASLIDNDGVTHLVDYTRIGTDTFVQQSSPEPQIAWSLINGTGIDPYTGLDPFNRVVDNRWFSTARSSASSSCSSSSGGNLPTVDLDRIQHGYDRASNRLWRKNTVADAGGANLDELYAYDGLYRLAEMQRGQLSGSNSGIVSGTLSFAQAWGLDASGNWQQFWENDSGSSWNLQQSRSASMSNEITAITGGGWSQPAYDAAGNMVQMPDGSTPTTADEATFDAWNRLMSVSADGSQMQQNAFDGENRRVMMLVSGTTRYYYYSVDWQDLEERVSTTGIADRQFVWGMRYIDDLVLRDSFDFAPSRLYALQDPNWNVTAICSSSSAVFERYTYAAYGPPTARMDTFAVTNGSAFGWETLYAGYRWDVASALFNVRARMYSPLLGVWSTRDAYCALSGSSSVTLDCAGAYAYANSNPLSLVDPAGRQALPITRPIIVIKPGIISASGGTHFKEHCLTQWRADQQTCFNNFRNSYACYDERKRTLDKCLEAAYFAQCDCNGTWHPPSKFSNPAPEPPAYSSGCRKQFRIDQDECWDVYQNTLGGLFGCWTERCRTEAARALRKCVQSAQAKEKSCEKEMQGIDALCRGTLPSPDWRWPIR